MARAIDESWSVLQSVKRPEPQNWDAETEVLCDGVERLSHIHLLPAPGAKKRQLSFLSKYLHACVNDAFPIWDANARTALGDSNDETSWSSYQNWLIRVRRETANHKACCLEHVALPGECLVRTLDKALYIKGRA
jgi:hypothetical protein